MYLLHRCAVVETVDNKEEKKQHNYEFIFYYKTCDRQRGVYFIDQNVFELKL